MKASVKLRDDEHKAPLIRAKLPISVLGIPLLSSAAVSAADASGDGGDLSLHLRTSFLNGPTLKLTYQPSAHRHPFSLTLKSGVGPFGSPLRSPLLIAARLSLPSGGGAAASSPPSFTIQIKPQLGDFFIKKTASSSPPLPNPNPRKENGGSGIYDPLPVDNSPSPRRDRSSLPFAVLARSAVPVSRRAAVNLRWRVNVSGPAMPCLTLDKISIETVEQAEVKSIDSKRTAMLGDVEAMRKEVEELQRDNRLIKWSVEEIQRKVSGGELQRLNSSVGSGRGIDEDGGKHSRIPAEAKASVRGGSGFAGKSRSSS